jgi:UDP-glucose 4-epimerase
MNSKVVILGSTGFVGAALSEAMRGRSDVLVEGYDSSILDLTESSCVDGLCEALDEQTILIVAARSRRTADKFECFWDDLAIATNVARSIVRRPVQKCLYFSTLSVYGGATDDVWITEETPIAPTSLYGVAKFAGECVMRQVARRAGIPFVALRCCKIYGPGDSSHAYGPVRFTESILQEGKVRLFGDGAELRDHVFVKDVVEVVIRFAFNDHAGIYNLASGESHSFKEIIAYLRKLSEREFDVVHVARDKPKIDQKVDPAKLLSALPGFRFTALEQGVKETYQYLSAALSARTE